MATSPLRLREVVLLGLAAIPLAGPESALAQPSAPPSPPPAQRRDLSDTTRNARPAAAGEAYSIGDPTDEEQLYLEFINRARTDPVAEGIRFVTDTDPDVLAAYSFFKVDLASVESQFRLIPPAPPISFHPALAAAARRHARDMLDHDFQGHTGTDGSNVGTRATAAGYTWKFIAENVYARARSVWHGHAGFNVDWGDGPGGIQSPPGHRNNIHDADVREIGIGVLDGVNGSVGPQVVAQALGDRPGVAPFVTGVVYYDFNGNQFYDPGEGIGGVAVRVSGTTTHAVSSRSGGYSVPVPGGGTRTVSFSVPGLPDAERTVSLPGNSSIKVDHLPTYNAPRVTGTDHPRVSRENRYTFSSVGAATSYRWQVSRRTPWTEPVGAETGLGPFNADTSPGYEVVDSFAAHRGGAAFHLAHLDPPRNQYLTLSQPLRLGAASALSFWSRHHWAAPPQVARVQLSTDDGETWSDLWTQAGLDGEGEGEYLERTIPLASYAERTVRLRFAYTFVSGTYYVGSQSGVGFYLDDIRVSDAETLGNARVQDVAAESSTFAFVPDATGSYLLQVRARIGDRELPWGPSLPVMAVEGTSPPEVILDPLKPGTTGPWEISFRVVVGSPSPSDFGLQVASNPAGPWAAESGATISAGPGPGSYTARFAPSQASSRFYRILSP